MVTVAIKYRIPLQAVTTDHEPLGITKLAPSRYTGIPVTRNAATTKSAVISMRCGVIPSPTGTARNRNNSGNNAVLTKRGPKKSSTMLSKVATAANCSNS